MGHELKDQYYIEFRKGDQTRFLKDVKEGNFKSWEAMAGFLGVGRTSVFAYLREQYKLPRCNFEKLKRLRDVDLTGYSFRENLFHTYKSFDVKVSYSIELAEIIGIVLGDGGMYFSEEKRNYETLVCFNKLEASYRDAVKLLLEAYFLNYKFFIYEAPSEFLVKNGSSFIPKYLVEAGLRLGNKTENEIAIPVWVFGNKGYVIACVRGIFDTDGSVYCKYAHYAQVQFKFASRVTLESVRAAVESLGFHPTKAIQDYGFKKHLSWKFYLSQQKEIENFFEEIKPRNEKHVERYNQIKLKQQSLKSRVGSEKVWGRRIKEAYTSGPYIPALLPAPIKWSAELKSDD